MKKCSARKFDMRDSSIVKKAINTTSVRTAVKGALKGELGATTTLWGTDKGARASAVPEKAKKSEPTKAKNHMQNKQSTATTRFDTPPPKSGRSHQVNKESEPATAKPRMAMSRINESAAGSNFLKGNKSTTKAADGTIVPTTQGKGEVKPTGRRAYPVNQSSDIFSTEWNKPNQKPAPPKAKPDFQETTKKGAVKSPWPGYSTAGQ